MLGFLSSSQVSLQFLAHDQQRIGYNAVPETLSTGA